MARVVSICLGLLICLGGSAWGDKPRIAILGLEAAVGAGGTIDPGAQLVAREITRELRQRVQSSTSPYVIAPNSNKELHDEKLLMSCDNEAPDCMVVIGAGLASDVVLYGRVDKKGETFRVSLKLLDVKRRTVQPASDDLPVGGAAAGVSRRLYKKLIGEDGLETEGVLLVRARSDSRRAVRGGSVKIDQEARGPLTGGKLTVPDLAEGRHTVTIEVPGFRRFEEIVTVRGGEQLALDALLRASAAEAPETPETPERVTPSRGASFWKWSAIGGAAVALGGAGYGLYAYDREHNHNVVRYQKPATGEFRVPDPGDCGKTIAQVQMLTNTTITTSQAVFDRACTWHTRNAIGIGVAVAGGVIAIGSLIMFSRDPGPPEGPASGARGKKSDVAVVPILTAQVAGAQLSLAW